jgi:hypothetical protein
VVTVMIVAFWYVTDTEFCKQISTFRKNIIPPFSRLKFKNKLAYIRIYIEGCHKDQGEGIKSRSPTIKFRRNLFRDFEN